MGKPTIWNLRIMVAFVLKLLGDGYTTDEIVREFPELEKECRLIGIQRPPRRVCGQVRRRRGVRGRWA
jgi:uncharacterized protein DUF433